MLQSLQQDHQNIAKLLKVLEQKLAHIRNEKAVKYKLIAHIISYMQEYADRYHHPKEDLIYDYYVKYRVVEDDLSNQLKKQHENLMAMTDELSDILDIILLDAVVPLDQFSDKLEAFINAQWEHLNYEEDVVFPALKRMIGAQLSKAGSTVITKTHYLVTVFMSNTKPYLSELSCLNLKKKSKEYNLSK